MACSGESIARPGFPSTDKFSTGAVKAPGKYAGGDL
jgi:hypothetical protein